jgi:uncharacterized protein (DUF736 family)
MNIGALWLKEKDGKRYFTGKIQYPNFELQIAIFKNENKTSENAPDYNIIWSNFNKKNNQQDQQQSITQPKSFNELDNDIPF